MKNYTEICWICVGFYLATKLAPAPWNGVIATAAGVTIVIVSLIQVF